MFFYVLHLRFLCNKRFYSLASVAKKRPTCRSHLYHYRGRRTQFVNILGEIVSCNADDSAYSYTFLRSVVCLFVVCPSHSCTMLKPLDGFRCHLACTLVGFNDTLC